MWTTVVSFRSCRLVGASLVSNARINRASFCRTLTHSSNPKQHGHKPRLAKQNDEVGTVLFFYRSSINFPLNACKVQNNNGVNKDRSENHKIFYLMREQQPEWSNDCMQDESGELFHIVFEF
jgi:hypothetical protein